MQKLTYKRESKDEVVAHIHEFGKWVGRLAFVEHKEWGLQDNYLQLIFDPKDFEVVDGETILDMKIRTAGRFMRVKEPAGKETEILFFRCETV